MNYIYKFNETNDGTSNQFPLLFLKKILSSLLFFFFGEECRVKGGGNLKKKNEIMKLVIVKI